MHSTGFSTTVVGTGPDLVQSTTVHTNVRLLSLSFSADARSDFI